MSYADKVTEAERQKIERKVTELYREAAADLRSKVAAYWDSYGSRLEDMRQLLADGEITEAHYRQWVRNNIGRGQRWEALRDEIARRTADTNKVAAAYINDKTPGIYSLNANYTAYQIEQAGKWVSFTLINEQAVKNLVEGNNQSEFKLSDGMGGYTYRRLHPEFPVDYAWNSDQIERQLTLGILAGEGVKGMTERFLSVMGSNRKAAIRNARTAITSAQNAGTLATMSRARDIGIRIKKQWLADDDITRTRESHQKVNGEQVEIDETFSNGLAYPGDPSGEPAEVYNCRCTMIYSIPGVNAPAEEDDGAAFEEWVEDKEAEVAEQVDDTAENAETLTDEQIERITSGNIHSLEDGTFIDEVTGDIYTESDIVRVFDNWDTQQITREDIEYTPFKTRDECVAYAKDVLGISEVDLSKMSVDRCNDVLQELTYLKEKYGVVPYEGLYCVSKGKHMAMAWTHGDDLYIKQKLMSIEKQIEAFDATRAEWAEKLNINHSILDRTKAPQLRAKVEKAIRQLEFDLGFTRHSVPASACNDGRLVEAITDHEFGHMMAEQKFGQLGGVCERDNILYDYVERKYNDFKADGTIHCLSKYGSTNSHEMVTEIFAMQESGEQMPVEFRIIYMRITNHELQQKKL